MGRKGNYGWEKRQRQLKKQKKKEMKAEKKRLAREAAAGEEAEDGDGRPLEAADGHRPGNGDASDGGLLDDEPGGDPPMPRSRRMGTD